MDLRHLTETLSVAPQILPEEIPAIADLGFRSLLCNRPDAEDPDQPAFSRIASIAEDHGLTVAFQPVVSGQVTDEDAAAFAAHLEALPAPVLAYCRTGTRCTVLWSLSRRGALPVDQILATARDAGYDLGALAPRLTDS